MTRTLCAVEARIQSSEELEDIQYTSCALKVPQQRTRCRPSDPNSLLLPPLRTLARTALSRTCLNMFYDLPRVRIGEPI
jgi:hypothetical protein